MIIAEADFWDVTTAISKEANTAMNANGRRKNVRRKRTKQLIAILLSITLITLAAAKPYQEANATGGLMAGGAGAAMSNPVSFLILAGIVGGVCIVAEAGKRGYIDKAAEKAKEDFVNYSIQALNNNVSAAEQERDNAAHARSVIEDWLETASAGVIDTSSEAWDWFRNFVSDIRNALGGGSSEGNLIIGQDLSGTYDNVLTFTDKSGKVRNESCSLEIKGLDVSQMTSNDCFLAFKVYENAAVVDITIAEIVGGAVRELRNGQYSQSLLNNATYRWIFANGSATAWENLPDGRALGLLRRNLYSGLATAYGLPLITAAAPSGTTDVPGVSNVNDYISIGSDLPYTRPEGAWDICDPNGKKGQVSIGQDIPANLGYDDWYDLLEGINTGQATWEEVANASDVIHIGSDKDSPYNVDNASDWSAYLNGTVVGYDVDAAGNVTITFEDGRAISIPQDQAGDIEWVNEQDKAQELDKDTDFPVSGTLTVPLDPVIEQDTPADPGDPGGSEGDMKVDPDVSDYTLDFRKLFPFCIPFDIYKAVKLLDASPTAPVVHYKFYLSKSKTYTIDLNLNKFNTVAAILRRMECLLFIIGLATATRRIYIRG